jgi:DNA repair protein RAD5
MEGSTTHKERTRIVETFQKDPSVQIFVVSLKTAGVGLNLVAANKVFLVDPWWNPGVEEQAIERVHRIGQKRSVEITRLIMDKSIEMRMLELNTGKKLLSQKVLSNESKPSESKVEKLKYLMAKY